MGSRDTARYLMPTSGSPTKEKGVQLIMDDHKNGNTMGETKKTKITSETKDELLKQIKNLQNDITEIVAEIDDFERLQLCRKEQRDNEFLSASRKFNMDPEKLSP